MTNANDLTLFSCSVLINFICLLTKLDVSSNSYGTTPVASDGHLTYHCLL